MKKENISVLRNFGPVTIYTDDLKAVAELLQTGKQKPKIVLKDKSHSYEFEGAEGIKEIEQLPVSSFHDIEITSYGDPHISIRLSDFQLQFYVSNDSVQGRGLMEKTIEILKPRNLYLSYALMSPVLPMVAAMKMYSLREANGLTATIITLALCAAWAVVGTVSQFKRFCTLHTRPRHAMPSFFVRRKDEVLLAVISGAVGAVLGAALTHAAGK